MLITVAWACHDFVYDTLTDQSSFLRFVEDNLGLGRFGDQSTDAMAGSLLNMLDFTHGPSNSKLFLDPTTGEPISATAAPFTKNGKLYISMGQLGEELNVNFKQDGHQVTFVWNEHAVTVPMHGRKVMVDGQAIDLGANMLTVQNSLFIPVDNLAQTLGVTVSGLNQGVAQWN